MWLKRRDFVLSAAATASAGLIWSGQRRGAQAQEAPPETTKVTLDKNPSICVMPEYVVEELLAAEVITHVDYVITDTGPLLSEAIASGQIDLAVHFSGPVILALDRGTKVTMLAGVHVGCFELFAKGGINSVADLKGKSVGVSELRSGPHVFLSAMASLVGLDPAKDINWVTSVEPKPIELFLDGKVDAFLGFPPEPQHLRGAGRQSCDRQQRAGPAMVPIFLLHADGQPRIHPDEAERTPSAWCARCCGRPISASARRLRSRGRSWTEARAPNYDDALQTLSDVPYGKWRDYDPEDTIRFYALRLHEAGMIKSSPDSDHRQGRRLALPARGEEGTRVMMTRELCVRT